MKVRSGFVSNSSSSSFVCDICGEGGEIMTDSGETPGVFWCENGHCFCSCHLDSKWSTENNKWGRYEYPEWMNEIVVKKTEGRHRTLADALEEDYDFYNNIPAEICPICRHEQPAISDTQKWLLKQLGFPTLETARKHIKSKFHSYEEFKKHLEEA